MKQMILEILKLALFVLSIPFKIILWLVEVLLFGYKAVWQRDELERIMNKRHDD